MDKELFRVIISENQEYIGNIPLIERPLDLEESGNYVFVGVRQAGKSYLLYQRVQQMLKKGTRLEDIVYINFDDERLLGMTSDDFDLILQAYHSMYDGSPVFFFDEIQNVDGWANFARRLANRKYRVYVTGSNSKGLSKDIATEFRGRATQIHVFPLCFEEYYSFVGGDEQKALDTYMLYGGMPRLLAMQDEKDKKDYLTSLYTELYVKDIVERNGIEREDILNDILNFLASQISSLTNPTNIANAIASMKNEKVNPALVSNYVQDIVDSFLISVAKRYDVKGKTYFNYPNKYYYTDIGLRNARLNYRQYDPGHIMENLIYNELLRRGYSVDVGVVTDRTKGANTQKEIDFVVNDADRKIYIQSAFRMDTEQKTASELDSLLLTKDFFKKIIVRMDIPHNFYDENGIFHCNLIDLLLGRVELF